MTGSIWNWSTTPASNGNADAGVNWQEGQTPSSVNDSARQMMGREAELLADTGGALAAGGTANAITVTANSAFTAYANGIKLSIRIAFDNAAGGATLNANALGNKAIRVMVGSGEADPPAGAMKAGGISEFRYGTSFNGGAGAWMLLNPVIDVPNLVTLTGSQTLTNKTLTSPVINTPTIATPTITNGTSSGMTLTTATVTQPTLTLKQSTTPTPTAEGVIEWDTDDDVLAIGSGAATKLFLPIPASTAAGDMEYYTAAKVLARLGIGTAAQVLQVNAGATAPQWATLSQTQSVATASGTSVNFTGIPTGVREITIMARGISFTASGTLKFRVGPSGGVVSTGYEGGYGLFQSASNAFAVTDSFYGGSTANASGIIMCFGKLVLVDPSNNVWGYTATAYCPNNNAFVLSSAIALSGALSQISFFESSGGTFDAGQFNIAWSM